jgi:hypothetical protein
MVLAIRRRWIVLIDWCMVNGRKQIEMLYAPTIVKRWPNMKTIQSIIEKEGGLEKLKQGCFEGSFYIKLVHPSKSMMPLVIEYVGEGPEGLPMVSVSHFYMQNGDVMRDPEMVFLVDARWSPNWKFTPMMYQQDGLGIYQEIIFKGEDGKWKVRNGMAADAKSFMKLWNRNLKEQGYLDVANIIATEAEKVASNG